MIRVALYAGMNWRTRPDSGLIRREMLRLTKRRAEAGLARP